jgi:trans-aconitate methyltransferase
MTDEVVNQGNVRRWVEALRSGDYVQGKGALAQDGKYCCLGVACEVALRNGVQMDVKRDTSVYYYDQHSVHLPRAVMEWLGITAMSPMVDYVDRAGLLQREFLTELNDLLGMPFAEIADAVEHTFLSKVKA